MALFGNKKEEKKEADVSAVKSVQSNQSQVLSKEDVAHVLLSPRITEKATDVQERGVYVFDVARNSNKNQIKKAVQQLYKVEPRKVRVVALPYKSVRHARTGKMGVKGGGKKAYVYLKEGDSISVI